MQLHDPLTLLVVRLYELCEQPLPLRPLAVLHERRDDGDDVLLVLLRAHALPLALLRRLHEQGEHGAEAEDVNELGAVVAA